MVAISIRQCMKSLGTHFLSHKKNIARAVFLFLSLNYVCTSFRTNGPYQCMIIPGFHQTPYETDFPPHTDVLKYLHSFADHFNLNERIKFQHMVIRVQPIENTKWEINAVNLSNDKHIKTIHDAVFVCNGHFFEPYIPHIDGATEFKGTLIHSHDFRSAEHFRGKQNKK